MQVDYIENSKLSIADKRLISLDHVTYNLNRFIYVKSYRCHDSIDIVHPRIVKYPAPIPWDRSMRRVRDIGWAGQEVTNDAGT